MYETIIIGAGIAGLTAAIYASRKRMDFAIISKDFGGQFMISGEILNYPGIPETTGAGFSRAMEEQMKKNEVDVKTGITVEGIEKKDGFFRILTDKDDFEARSVIIATGSHARKLGVDGEERLANKGVTYCAICDGPLFRDKEVAIFGGGDSALEAVDFMKDIASKIHLIVLEDRLDAHEYLIERVEGNDKVDIIYNAKTTEIFGDKFVEGIRYEQDGEEKELKVQGAIIEIGRIPNTNFAKDFLDVDDHDHIKIDCQARTSVDGVFAAGDCAAGHEYQYVIAAGQGCMALIKAARYLARRKKDR